MNAKNLGFVMASLSSVRESVRNPTIPMRPSLFGGKLHGEMRLIYNRNGNKHKIQSQLICIRWLY